jgi:hypothetical protein
LIKVIKPKQNDFIKCVPGVNKSYISCSTFIEDYVQILTELTALRFNKNDKNFENHKNSVFWIDQAKQYYQSAVKSPWQTSGLLYYYSFLNLAKALLVSHNKISITEMQSISIHHGLSLNNQNPKRIDDFVIKIHSQPNNVFPHLYETTIGENWTLGDIEIRLGDILGYSYSISSEVNRILDIDTRFTTYRALTRNVNGKTFLELCFPKTQKSILNCGFSFEPIIIDGKELEDYSKIVWESAFRMLNVEINQCIFWRSPETTDGLSEYLLSLNEEFATRSIIYPVNSQNYSGIFFEELEVSGKKIAWSSFLTDYIFSFVLSHISRYNPHLISYESVNALIAESWCNQAGIECLRSLLRDFSDPMIIVN